MDLEIFNFPAMDQCHAARVRLAALAHHTQSDESYRELGPLVHSPQTCNQIGCNRNGIVLSFALYTDETDYILSPVNWASDHLVDELQTALCSRWLRIA